jgi:DNA-binding transcriptional LysR family regulator
MDKSLSSLDWSLIQSFLAVAEEGSLSAAARRLGASQPTLGRQIQQIETQLGISLFHRQPRGLKLTPIGETLLEPAKTMQAAMGQIALTAAGQEQDIKGAVRITASIFVAQNFLPQVIAKIRQEEPQISIDLVASDTSENLLFREADIALRMYRPEQLDVVTRHLGDMSLGMFGAVEYLDRRGRPTNLDQLLN